MTAPDIRNIICVGLNYKDHALESNLALPEQPLLFAKWTSALSGPEDPILLPQGEETLDFEAELAIVIGTAGFKIPEEQALTLVYGYAVANDVSLRRWQIRDGQWTAAKSYPSFLPLGEIVPAQEISDPQNLRITTTVNGEIRQDSTTAEMVFTVAELVSYISQQVALGPGDIILTGTPAGVGMGQTPPRYLSAGDVVTIEIEGLGRISNRVVSDTRLAEG